jgi:protein-S-isoprenylcysteine O-methyltransferase Ste14
MREKRGTQRSLIYWTYPFFLALYILPGLDYRFGWSHLPVWMVIAGAVLFLAGYAGFLWVLLTNRFAGRTVEVDTEQKVISSGPYALIRHPMYCADILIFIGSTLTLGSLPAMVLSLLVIPVLILRILDEEKALRQELHGYDAYCLKVRYRLLPGIW